ncbi:MAG: hypothetical protein IOB84_13420 [Brevundimonas sp.]|nr:hypothetical protein [Brevundimonas sp.]
MPTPTEELETQKAMLEGILKDLRAEKLEADLQAAMDRQLVQRLIGLLADVARAGGDLAQAEIADALSSSRHTLASPPTNDWGIVPGDPGFAGSAEYMRHEIAALEEVQRLIRDEAR